MAHLSLDNHRGQIAVVEREGSTKIVKGVEKTGLGVFVGLLARKPNFSGFLEKTESRRGERIMNGSESASSGHSDIFERFLDELQQTGNPDELLGQFCGSHPNLADELRIQCFLHEFDAALECDAVLDRYCRRFPHLAMELREQAAMAARLGQLASAGERQAIDSLSATTSVEKHEQLPADWPDQVGPYAIEGKIGQGGMGLVLRGKDLDFNRILAIKVLLPERQGNPEMIARFFKEAQIMGQLQHPGIPPVHAFSGPNEPLPYLAMKLVKGRTLSSLLNERGTRIKSEIRNPKSETIQNSEIRNQKPHVDLPHLLGIFEQVCQTLAYAHSRDVIHRDLKPSNIMVGAFGEVQVMDWGLAKKLGEPSTEEIVDTEISTVQLSEALAADSSATQGGEVIGTLSYMPPEQACGKVAEVDERCDVFSLGAILCVLLTGKPPYQAVVASELYRQARAGELADAWTGLEHCGADPELVALAKRCLAPDKESRLRHAGEVADAVKNYQHQVQERLRKAERDRAAAQARAEEEQKRRRVERQRSRLRLALAAAALILLVAVGAAVLWYRSQLSQAQQHLANARDLRGKLHAELRKPGGVFYLLNNPSRWEAQIHESKAVLGVAQALTVDFLFGIDPKLVAAMNELTGELKQDDDDRKLALALEQVRLDRATLAERMVADVVSHADRRTSTLGKAATGNELNDPTVLSQVHGFLPPRAAMVVQVKFNNELALKMYPKKFKSGELEIENGKPQALAKRIKQSPIRELLVAALDDWALAARLQKRNDLQHRLLEITRLADPDPWRDRVRDPKIWDDDAKMQKLAKTMSNEPKNLARLSPQTLALVGSLLPRKNGHRAHWLRRGQRLFAGDFWLTFDLAVALVDSKPVEAEGMYRAALAIRPNSIAAWYNLGHCLRRQQKPDEAAYAFEKALSIYPRFPACWTSLGFALADQKKLNEAEAAFLKALKIDSRDAVTCTDFGKFCIERGKVDEAIANYKKAVAHDPQLGIAWFNLGVAYKHQKKLDDAIAAYRRASELRPKDAGPWNNLGKIFSSQMKLAEAKEAYRQAVQVEPDYATGWYNLGHVLAEQKSYRKAIEALQQAVQLEPDFASAWFNLGKAYQDLGKHADAEAAYSHAIKHKPDFDSAYNNLGVALAEQKRYAEAEAAYHTAIRLNPDNDSPRINLGNGFHRRKKFAEAETEYLHAIKLDQDDAAPWFNLGQARSEQKKYAGAALAYRRAVKLKPDYARAHHNLGFILFKQNKFSEAEKAHRKAITLKPNYVLAHNGAAAAFLRQNKIAEAEAACRRALELKEDYEIAWFNLGLALRSQKKFESAVTAFKEALRIDPQYAAAYRFLGHALHEFNKLDEAIPALQKAAEIDPKLKLVYGDLGQAWRYKGDWQKAEFALRKALELDRKYDFAYYELGCTFADKGDLEEAIKVFRQGIRIFPKYSYFHYELGWALFGQGKFRAARSSLQKAAKLLSPKARYYKSWVNLLKRCERLAELERKLTLILNGTAKPQNAAEQLELADMCLRYVQRYRVAVQLYSGAFAGKAQLATDVTKHYRYSAACAAALAQAFQGKDWDKIDAQERATLRRQALDWLQADLQTWNKLLHAEPPMAMIYHKHLKRARNDADLAGVRDNKELAKIPAGERQSWRNFWSEVARLEKTTCACFTESRLNGSLTYEYATEQSHPVKMTAGKSYCIEMQSNQFDAELRLENDQGEKLAENKHPSIGKFRNARIFHTPKQDGVYRLIATSFLRGAQGGAYTITVRTFLGK